MLFTEFPDCAGRPQARLFPRWMVLPLLLTFAGRTTPGQTTGLSLRQLPVPQPGSLAEYVRDRQAAIILGKALFWDMQVGSDGIVACATCHFHAGADSRSKNQHNPGSRRVNAQYAPWPDTIFDRGPNWQLTPADFPLRLLGFPDIRGSRVLRDSNDIVGSQGVFLTEFRDTDPGKPEDKARSVPDADGFRIGN